MSFTTSWWDMEDTGEPFTWQMETDEKVENQQHWKTNNSQI